MPANLRSSIAPQALAPAAPAPAEDGFDPLLLGAPAMAIALGVTERTVRHWIQSGILAAIKVGSHWGARQSWLRAFVAGLETEALAQAAHRRAALAAAKEARAKKSQRAAPEVQGVPKAPYAASKPPRRKPSRRLARAITTDADLLDTNRTLLDTTVANKILMEIDKGLPDDILFSNHPNASKPRSATRIVQKHLPGVSDAQARQIVTTWMEDGTLHEVEFRSPRGLQKGLKLDRIKLPGASATSPTAGPRRKPRRRHRSRKLRQTEPGDGPAS
jgi:hypothetical protein